MYGWLFAFMLIVGGVLFLAGMLELFAIGKTGSWKVGGLCLLAGIILVAVAVLVERSILGVVGP
jgi:hypothetical protein